MELTYGPIGVSIQLVATHFVGIYILIWLHDLVFVQEIKNANGRDALT
jgi:hypothetical protein